MIKSINVEQVYTTHRDPKYLVTIIKDDPMDDEDLKQKIVVDSIQESYHLIHTKLFEESDLSDQICLTQPLR